MGEGEVVEVACDWPHKIALVFMTAFSNLFWFFVPGRINNKNKTKQYFFSPGEII